MSQIFNKIERFIRRHNLLDEHSKVVVGVSGGADSVFLLRTLIRLGCDVVAVHCNFHLRGEESDRDERFVRNLCDSLAVELVVAEFDTNEYATSHHMSIELAARELRYDFFQQMMEKMNAECIAVAHHRDDNVETLIWNMVRGTGIRGLRGMLPKNGNVVRPLLCVGRNEIVEALRMMGQDFIVDSTNLQNDVTRNKIRLDVLPMLRELNAGADGNISTMMENMYEVWNIYSDYVAQMKERCCERRNGKLIIDVSKLEDCVSVISVLHEILSPMGFNRHQTENMLNALSGKEFTAAGEGKYTVKVKVSGNGKRKLSVESEENL